MRLGGPVVPAGPRELQDLGAAFNGSRLNSLYRASVPSAEIVGLVRPLLRQYSQERLPGERFGDFTIRAGIVRPTLGPLDFHDKAALAPVEGL